MTRARVIARFVSPVEPPPPRPRRVFTDAQILALSDCCWFCGDGVPVAVHHGQPACERCSTAFRENAPRPGIDVEAP